MGRVFNVINEKEKKLIDELNELRFLDSDKQDEDEMEEDIEEKIERYEKIVFELSSSNRMDIILYLCDIAEDRATESASVEYLMKMIIKLSKNNIEEGIRYIIRGMVSMIPKAYYKALFLTRLIINDNELLNNYAIALENSTDEEKVISKMLLLRLKRNSKEIANIDFILKKI